jgi:cysteine-rich repeat protein
MHLAMLSKSFLIFPVLLGLFACGGNDDSSGSGTTGSGATSGTGAGSSSGATGGGGGASTAVCGDGVVDGDELCDDGVASADCDQDCTPVECGDGLRNLAAGEACDDGNFADGDACSAQCAITAFELDGPPNVPQGQFISFAGSAGDVGLADDGRFVAGWETDGMGAPLRVQAFEAPGAPVGAPYMLPSFARAVALASGLHWYGAGGMWPTDGLGALASASPIPLPGFTGGAVTQLPSGRFCGVDRNTNDYTVYCTSLMAPAAVTSDSFGPENSFNFRTTALPNGNLGVVYAFASTLFGVELTDQAELTSAPVVLSSSFAGTVNKVHAQPSGELDVFGFGTGIGLTRDTFVGGQAIDSVVLAPSGQFQAAVVHRADGSYAVVYNDLTNTSMTEFECNVYMSTYSATHRPIVEDRLVVAPPAAHCFFVEAGAVNEDGDVFVMFNNYPTPVMNNITVMAAIVPSAFD